MNQNIIILGSTGSIGLQALKVIRNLGNEFKIVGLSANTDIKEMTAQVKEFLPETVAMADKKAASALKKELLKMKKTSRTKVLGGEEGVIELAGFKKADIVLNSLVGSIGILPTLAAIRQGGAKRIALANKETLVAAGALVMKEAKRNHKQILPVDSEHSAIFQCLMGEGKSNIENIILTCSGGPFLNTPKQKLENIAPSHALKHPKWNMGPKISIDSATLINKGLEVIEAHWLFGLEYEKIKVLIHPQSLVHSLVEFKDGSLKTEISEPTMMIPIQLALTYPYRARNKKIKRLSLWDSSLTFARPNLKKFPCLKYAYEAGKIGGTMPAALNAANEAAVNLFLNKKISYLSIARNIEKILKTHQPIANPSLNDILAVDRGVKEKIIFDN